MNKLAGYFFGDDDAGGGSAELTGFLPTYLAGLADNISPGITSPLGPSATAHSAKATLVAPASRALPPVPAYPPFIGLPSLPALLKLATLPQWIAWKYIAKPGEPKARKVPFDPTTGRRAKSDDPATWGSYAKAAGHAKRQNMPGVGFMLSPDDGLTGIDLDDCRDRVTGELEPWAAEVVAFAETYTEVSPSGGGIRLFALGKVAKATAMKAAGVEIYGGGRYLTVTGQHIEGTPDTIASAPETLAVLHARVETFKAEAQARKAEQALKGIVPAEDPAPTGEAGGFFRTVNSAALVDLAAWVTALLPFRAPERHGLPCQLRRPRPRARGGPVHHLAGHQGFRRARHGRRPRWEAHADRPRGGVRRGCGRVGR